MSQLPPALFLSAEAPFPTVGGGALRSSSLLQYLSRHYSVDIIVFRQPESPDPASEFPAGLARRISVINLPFHSKDPVSRVTRNLMRLIRNRPPLIDRFSGFASEVASALDPAGYEIAIVEHIWCAPYVQQLRPHSGLMVLDVHNIESTWHERVATTESSLRGLALRRFAGACRRFEKKWAPKYDALLVTSREDSKLLKGTSKIIYPNALPLVPQPAKRRDDSIIFTGNLEYQPNLSAIVYFKDKIWPLLRQRFPKLIWRIAGKNSNAVRGIVDGDSSIQVTGEMDDSIATIAGAKVAAVPLLAGSGTRFKILEAWAAGTPVVSTSLGAEGLTYTEGEHLLIADEPERFAEAIAFLLDEPAARAQLAEKGRRLYETRYTWDVAWKMLSRDLSPLLGGAVGAE